MFGTFNDNSRLRYVGNGLSRQEMAGVCLKRLKDVGNDLGMWEKA